MTETAIEQLEAEWAALGVAFETQVVAWHAGRPFDADAYPTLRRAFERSLGAAEDADLGPEDRRAVANIRASLPSFDDFQPVDGVGEALDDGEDPAIGKLRRATYDAYGEAAANIAVGGERLDRLTVMARLATEPDAAARRGLFEALIPVYQAVDGDGGADSPYRRLNTASAARWDKHGSMIEANAAALGIPAGAFEPMLQRMLAAGRARLTDVAGHDRRIEPWDYRYLVGEAERRLGPLVTVEQLQPINDAHLRALGADPDALHIGYDVDHRRDRPVIPVAFTTYGVEGPWVFATYEDGGIGNLTELFHESGHALHMAAIQTRPAFRYVPDAYSAFFEAVADVLAFDVSEPAFQAHHLGASVEPAVASLDRYGGALLEACWSLFEIELHRSPDRRPNDVWAEVVADRLGLEPHPDWSWWAVRGQLIDLPGYLANYVLSAIAASALRAAIRAERRDWSTGDPGWYPFVAERLLRFGAERPPATLIADLLGGPLTDEPMLADLAG